MLQRSLVRSSAILLALGVLAAAACARLDPTRDPQSPTPVPKAAFSDVTLEETGGIDGRHNVLLVRTDGVAISMSWKPSENRRRHRGSPLPAIPRSLQTRPRARCECDDA
jgi:hypothetical protein